MNGTEPVGQYALRPMPDDFKAVAAMPVYKLMRMFRARRETIQRWIRACGIEPGPRAPSNKRLVPDDFAERAAEMHRTALCDHYNADESIVRRWVIESGIEPIAYAHRPGQRKLRASRTGGGMRANLKAVGAINLATVRNWSDADDAAAKLRKFGPVHRCDEQGRFDIAGHFWRAGWAILTDAEIIERANRRRAA